ncbi:MAG: class I SAM-dependent methyltransferase, partial [Deltaproteobacteria bacterium]|nr:class I SAM-dependent methyltransferase [Deltaproteobacteria bacterium]
MSAARTRVDASVRSVFAGSLLRRSLPHRGMAPVLAAALPRRSPLSPPSRPSRRVEAALLLGGLAVLLALPAFADQPRSPLLRAERVRQQAAWCDVNLLLLHLNAGFWLDWSRIDASIEEMLLEQHPAAAERVTWRDPGVRLGAIGWLLAELARSTDYLLVLGRGADAERVLASAERLAAAAAGRGDALDVLLANTFARFLLVGWRDSADPLVELEIQADAVVRNVAALRKAVRLPDLPLRTLPLPSPALGTLLGAACTGRAGNLLPHSALVLAAGLRRTAASLFPTGGLPLPALPLVAGERHAAATDDAALALSIPFSLAPVAAELELFLVESGPYLPQGPVLLLGAGDGGEALRVAKLETVDFVLAVDHSGLAVERIGRMVNRLRYLPQTARIRALRTDVRECSFDDSTFSLAVASHLVEYLDQLARLELYRKLSRWVKPGG